MNNRPPLQPVMTEQQSPLWTPNEADLRQLHDAGVARYGVMLGAKTADDHILMLQHRGSDKCKPGMWGPLGETSQVARDENNSWQVEPTTQTIARGFSEELAIHRQEIGTLAIAYSLEPKVLRFPVGINYGDTCGAVQCLAPVLTPALAERCLAAEPTAEIMHVQLMEPAEIRALDDDHIRPGTRRWLQQIMKVDALVEVTYEAVEEPWSHGAAHIQDALLYEMFPSHSDV